MWRSYFPILELQIQFFLPSVRVCFNDTLIFKHINCWFSIFRSLQIYISIIGSNIVKITGVPTTEIEVMTTEQEVDIIKESTTYSTIPTTIRTTTEILPTTIPGTQYKLVVYIITFTYINFLIYPYI